MGLPKRKVVFQSQIFRGKLLVSGRVWVCIFLAKVPTFSKAGIFDFGEGDSAKQTPERDSGFCLSEERDARSILRKRPLKHTPGHLIWQSLEVVQLCFILLRTKSMG